MTETIPTTTGHQTQTESITPEPLVAVTPDPATLPDGNAEFVAVGAFRGFGHRSVIVGQRYPGEELSDAIPRARD